MSADTETYNVYQLAQMAEVTSPDSDSSPGAEWLARVALGAAELITEQGTDWRDGDAYDVVHETADNAVPIYTHERWQVFVDLAAYTEDVNEIGLHDDLTGAAGVALFMIAERLILAIVEDQAEQSDEDEDGEE